MGEIKDIIENLDKERKLKVEKIFKEYNFNIDENESKKSLEIKLLKFLNKNLNDENVIFLKKEIDDIYDKAFKTENVQEKTAELLIELFYKKKQTLISENKQYIEDVKPYYNILKLEKQIKILGGEKFFENSIEDIKDLFPRIPNYNNYSNIKKIKSFRIGKRRSY